MMIEINLLPQELRVKAKKPGFSPDRSLLVLIVPAVILVIVIADVCLWITVSSRNNALARLSREWEQLGPQRQQTAETRVKYNALLSDSSARRQATGHRVVWAEKLSAMSRHAPSGMWFRELSISPKEFILHASVVVVSKDEMGIIKSFVDNLKQEPGFVSDFGALELGAVKKKIVGQFSVADFTLTGTLQS